MPLLSGKSDAKATPSLPQCSVSLFLREPDITGGNHEAVCNQGKGSRHDPDIIVTKLMMSR